MKKIMKRIISTLLALCLIMGVVPMKTYAMVGALTNPDIYTPSWEIATDVYKGYQTNWIENQYIRMYWLTETSGEERREHLSGDSSRKIWNQAVCERGL